MSESVVVGAFVCAAWMVTHGRSLHPHVNASSVKTDVMGVTERVLLVGENFACKREKEVSVEVLDGLTAPM